MAFWTQLMLLLWKNFQYRRRQPESLRSVLDQTQESVGSLVEAAEDLAQQLMAQVRAGEVLGSSLSQGDEGQVQVKITALDQLEFMICTMCGVASCTCKTCWNMQLYGCSVAMRASLYLQQMPYLCYVDDAFLHVLSRSLPLFLTLAWIYLVSLTVKAVVREETRLRYTMRAMELSGTVLWLGWFLSCCLWPFLSTILLVMVLKLGDILPYSHPVVLFLFLAAFAVVTVVRSFLLSTFSHANLAAACGGLMYFVLYLPYVLCVAWQDQLPLGGRVAASILSPVAFGFGCESLALLEEQADVFSLAQVSGLLLLDAAHYGLTTWYLETVSRCLHKGPGEALPDNPMPALCGLSLDCFQGHITAFLSCNGAGKTITLSILSGLFPPPGGSAYILGHDVQSNMAAIRPHLGVCPQYNVLFDMLTMDEHIWFYSRLKGLSVAAVDSEQDSLLQDLGLVPKRCAQTRHLSGGMQRKLSVAIAFVSGSRVVILDEPTAGADPASRHNTWELLLKYREGRTLILSTHHQEEAELLGDRVAVVAGGHLCCCGSLPFLRRHLGSGYYLMLAKSPQSLATSTKDDTNLEDGMDSWQERELGSLDNRAGNPQLLAVVQHHIPGAQLVKELPHELVLVLPYGSALDGSFAKLFCELDQRLEELGLSGHGISDTSLEEIFLKVVEDCCGHRPRGLALLFSLIMPPFEYYPALRLSPSMYGAQVSFFSEDAPEDPEHVRLLAALLEEAGLENSSHRAPKCMQPTICWFSVPEVPTDVAEVLASGNWTPESPSPASGGPPPPQALSGSGEIVQNLTGRNLSDFLVKTYPGLVCQGPTCHAHSITTFNHPLNLTKEQLSEATLMTSSVDVLVSICVVFTMSFIPASFTLVLIEERVTRAKHLQFMGGLPPTLYWFGNFLWDMLVDHTTHIPSLLLLLRAYVTLTCIGLFIGINSSTVTFMLELLSDQKLQKVSQILKQVFLIFPHFCLGRGLIDMVRNQAMADAFERFGDRQFQSPLCWEVVDKNLLAMVVQGTRLPPLHSSATVPHPPLATEDVDVAHERERVVEGATQGDVLVLRNLTKVYPQQRTPAVDRLCLGIPPDETVSSSLGNLGLQQYADLSVGTYSGGNKWKLATAVALVGDPTVVFLDEPTSGVDPSTKRFLWNSLLSVVREGRSVVLTSHSMEECEALCTCLAIMVNGRFRCLGNLQHLKGRFRADHTLTLRVSAGKSEPVAAFVAAAFPGAELRKAHGSCLRFQLLPGGRCTLAHVFGELAAHGAEQGVEDFSVSQTTLEEVFLYFLVDQGKEEERKDHQEARVGVHPGLGPQIPKLITQFLDDPSIAETVL
ncbi:phospholipid-transporting ATPase ABCA7 [Saccopteryx leptura]|uniref:phospholipid-transporting ATPase ABCA7 n=1 Tax=Saccopteryx leptura TaxID=249018 RepID=UPI00339CBBE4